MRHPLLLSFCSILILSGCAASAPNEQQLLEQIEKTNYCETKEDCELIGSKCPFDCYIYVNAKEAGRVKRLVDNFQSTCTYSCIRSEGVECQEGRCVVQLPLSKETAGNVGAECQQDSECITPLAYMMRSSCPFSALCIDSHCAVVCPQMTGSENPRMDGYQMTACKQDSDCTCSNYAGDDKIRCACENSACVAVVKE